MNFDQLVFACNTLLPVLYPSNDAEGQIITICQKNLTYLAFSATFLVNPPPYTTSTTTSHITPTPGLLRDILLLYLKLSGACNPIAYCQRLAMRQVKRQSQPPPTPFVVPICGFCYIPTLLRPHNGHTMFPCVMISDLVGAELRPKLVAAVYVLAARSRLLRTWRTTNTRSHTQDRGPDTRIHSASRPATEAVRLLFLRGDLGESKGKQHQARK